MMNLDIFDINYIQEYCDLYFQCLLSDIPFRYWATLNTTGQQIRNNQIIWSGKIAFWKHNNDQDNLNKRKRISNGCYGKLINNKDWKSGDKLEINWTID